MAFSAPTPVELLLRERLAEVGKLTFAEFSELVLYAPEVGYYTSQTVLGEGGDYVTSPEVHPAFGALLGRQLEDCWQALDRPSCFTVREVGAGRGLLCRDVLQWARAEAPDLAASLRYQIVERSPALQARQQATLLGVDDAASVEWIDPDAQAQAAGRLRGCVLSNELLDSFPVHLVTVRQGELRELYVSLGVGGLELVEDAPSTPELERYFTRLGVWPGEGCRAEVNLRAVDWMALMASWLDRGLALTLDYGYPARELYSPQRRHGTLLCYYRHTLSSDPLQRLGRQDITSHVDFTTLARVGEQHGLATIGLISQARLLSNLGLPSYLGRVDRLSSPGREANRRALLELVDPDGLGRVGALLQQRGMDDYVPLALRSDTPLPEGSYLPSLGPGALRWPFPEQMDGLPDFERMWRAFVSGDERELDAPEELSLSFFGNGDDREE